MPSTPLHTSTHLNLPIASSTMSSHPTSTSSTRGHADKPTSKPKQTSSLLDRLKTASSSDKWAEPGGGGGGSTGPSSSSSLSSHGPGKRAGGMSWPTATITPTSATTNTSPSKNPNPLNYSDRDRVQGGTQESLSWSPSPDRPKPKTLTPNRRRAGLPTPAPTTIPTSTSHPIQNGHPPSSSGSHSEHSAWSQQFNHGHRDGPGHRPQGLSQTSPTRQPKFNTFQAQPQLRAGDGGGGGYPSIPTATGIRPLKLGGPTTSIPATSTSATAPGRQTSIGVDPPNVKKRAGPNSSLPLARSRSRSRSNSPDVGSGVYHKLGGGTTGADIDERQGTVDPESFISNALDVGDESMVVDGDQVERVERVAGVQEPGGFCLDDEDEDGGGGSGSGNRMKVDKPMMRKGHSSSTSNSTSTKSNSNHSLNDASTIKSLPSSHITPRSTTTTTSARPNAPRNVQLTPEEKERAKESRRRAMMAAMNSMSAVPTPTTASSSKLTTIGTASREASPLVRSGSGSGIKRGLGEVGGSSVMPWEANGLTAASKVTSTVPRPLPTPTTARGANTDSTLNIRQKVILSSEQRNVLNMVVDQGRSVFFTGSAGTGKSVLLREIIRALRKKFAARADAVAVTASTGIAACNIGGVTIHSFGGIGLGADTPEKLCMNIRKNKKALSRWTRTKVLIMDEVSMVDGDLFDKLSKIGSILNKKPDRPFGGIQIVVTGDFFQLPPVTKHNKSPTFAFEAATWNDTVTACVNLTKVFRQRDQTFVDMLNEMRFGKMTKASIDRFAGLRREIVYTDGIEPTELFPRREDVERANQTRLQQLHCDSWEFKATDGPGPVNDSTKKILQNMMAAESIVLKLNAQVMLIKNVDETLVNGSMGKVIGFCEKHLYREDMLNRWAGEVGPEESDEDDSVGEDGAPKKKRKTSTGPKPPNDKRRELLPVVSFRVPGGVRDVLVEKDTFKTELPNGEIQASRIQLPLILAWAMSIHKSQGQTLDRVKVDLSRVFEKGQAYVALSRATSMEGLQVTGFNPAKVMAHHKVTTWSQNLVTYE